MNIWKWVRILGASFGPQKHWNDQLFSCVFRKNFHFTHLYYIIIQNHQLWCIDFGVWSLKFWKLLNLTFPPPASFSYWFQIYQRIRNSQRCLKTFTETCRDNFLCWQTARNQIVMSFLMVKFVLNNERNRNHSISLNILPMSKKDWKMMQPLKIETAKMFQVPLLSIETKILRGGIMCLYKCFIEVELWDMLSAINRGMF